MGLPLKRYVRDLEHLVELQDKAIEALKLALAALEAARAEAGSQTTLFGGYAPGKIGSNGWGGSAGIQKFYPQWTAQAPDWQLGGKTLTGAVGSTATDSNKTDAQQAALLQQLKKYDQEAVAFKNYASYYKDSNVIN